MLALPESLGGFNKLLVISFTLSIEGKVQFHREKT